MYAIDGDGGLVRILAKLCIHIINSSVKLVHISAPQKYYSLENIKLIHDTQNSDTLMHDFSFRWFCTNGLNFNWNSIIWTVPTRPIESRKNQSRPFEKKKTKRQTNERKWRIECTFCITFFVLFLVLSSVLLLIRYVVVILIWTCNSLTLLPLVRLRVVDDDDNDIKSPHFYQFFFCCQLIWPISHCWLDNWLLFFRFLFLPSEEEGGDYINNFFFTFR